jgi:transaldolase
MAKNPAQQLHEFGQSVWYDNISRDLLKTGELKRMIDEWGVRGLTSNPTIFDQAISKSSMYDDSIKSWKQRGLTADEAFEALAIEDIGAAADLLRPVFDSSGGDDGFVSIEVSPLLAANTAGTIEEGRKLFKLLNRPNIMVKVPGTAEGLPAIHTLLAEGINVNITLLFSVENYVDVANTYCTALRERMKGGQPVDKVRSVASFFVSRVDTIIDKQLEKIAAGTDAKANEAKALLGKFGVANSKLAYEQFQKIFISEQFHDLKRAGAAYQRPLWASTSTKNPAYRDVIYVEDLIGAHTVNTMPHSTLVATIDHAVVADNLSKGIPEAHEIKRRIEALGIDIAASMNELQVDGVKKFSESFVTLNESLKKKLSA